MSSNNELPKLVRITTVSLSLEKLLTGQMKFMQENGFRVYIVSSGGDNVELLEKREKSKFIPLNMTRTISPFKDIISFFRLIKILKKLNPEIVHTQTLKGGLIGMIAAWFCKVPVRLHTVAGLQLKETKGVKKKLFIWVEKITYRCASNIYPNSPELKNYLEENKFISANKLKVLGNGSSNGINVNHFKETDCIRNEAWQLRKKYNISSFDTVFIFIGRIVKDKGINELVKAFQHLNEKYHTVKLFLVGSFEDDLDPIDAKSKEIISLNKNIICTGFVDDIRPYLAASDVLAFPSYREGFPNVPMQAGCFNLPCIVTDINGCNEIIEHEVNGLIVPPKDEHKLHSAMENLLVDKSLYLQLQSRARKMIVERYQQEHFLSLLLNEYRVQLERRGLHFDSLSLTRPGVLTAENMV